MDQVFVFNKSYEQRLQEYEYVLGEKDILPVTKIKKEWSHYLQLVMEPKNWRAIWKIPRITCEKLHIDFPTMVLVYVENIDFFTLTAMVEVLCVPNNISLPTKNNVNLIELWITKDQDENFSGDIEVIANTLDMLQFFYIYLLFPWDYEEESTNDWLNTHLEVRLHLFYDMRNGSISRPANERLKWLLNKARRLHALCEKDVCDTIHSNHAEELLEIHIELLKTRTEVQLLENPLLRSTYLKRCYKLHGRDVNGTNSQNWLVSGESKLQKYIDLLKNARSTLGNKNVRSLSTLARALEVSDSNDIILLNKGMHYIVDTAGIPPSATLKGLYSQNETVISSEKDGVMFDCFGNVTLENLTINVNCSQYGFCIRNGHTVIKNCHIIGGEGSLFHRGIVVQPESSLCMIDCEITGFYVGIFGNSKGSVTIRNCKISQAVIGIQILDYCTLAIENLIFNNCKQFGVYADTGIVLEAGCFEEGDFSLLHRIQNVVAKNVTGENVGKRDVIIMHKTNSLIIDDLFCTSEHDSTIIENLSEATDFNDTIIKNQMDI